MKYIVKCPKCGRTYELEMGLKPVFCAKCGDRNITVSPVKTKSRVRAEEAMNHMDQIRPRLEKAHRVYVELMGEWEFEMQILRQYKKRGIVTEDEVASYMQDNFDTKKISEALRNYRENRKKENEDNPL